MSILVDAGQWAAHALVALEPYATPALIAVGGWALSRAPLLAGLAGMLKDKRVDAALERAVAAGFGAAEGALQSKVLTIPETNAVLDAALEWAIKMEPAFASWAEDQVKAFLYARLSAYAAVPANATTASVNVAVPAARRAAA